MTVELLVAAGLAPLLVAYLIACFRDPLRYALPPYAVLIPFSSLISIGGGPFGSLSSLLGLLLGVALLTQLVTTGRGSVRLSLAVPVWLAFLALTGLSLFWSIAPRATAEGFLVLGSLVLLFAALAITRVDAVVLRRFEWSIVAGGILVVCYGLVQLLFLGGLPAFNGPAGRFGDDLLGANNQAAALLLPIAITAGWALSRAGLERLLHIGVTLLLLLGVVMTGSRGGLLATFALLAVLLVLGVAARGVKVAVAGAAALLLAALLVVNPGNIGERQLERQTSSGRAEIWAVGLHACPQHCLTGAGWGGFPAVYAAERADVPEARVLRRGTAYEAHNIYLLAVVEAGVVGLGLVLLGFGLALRSALRLPRVMRAPPVAALVGTFVSSFFLSNLEYKFFWAVLSYVVMAEAVALAAAGPPRSPVPTLRVPAR